MTELSGYARTRDELGTTSSTSTSTTTTTSTSTSTTSTSTSTTTSTSTSTTSTSSSTTTTLLTLSGYARTRDELGTTSSTSTSTSTTSTTTSTSTSTSTSTTSTSTSTSTTTTLSPDKLYTKGDYNVLPEFDTDLKYVFISADYTAVSINDGSSFASTAVSEFAVFLFKDRSDIQGGVEITWIGQTTNDPSVLHVDLQIFNRTTQLWETIDQNILPAINENFTLTAIVNGDMNHYYNELGWIACRVYQEEDLS